MYTTDTLLMSCEHFSMSTISQGTSEGVPTQPEELQTQKTSMTISEALASCLTQAVREKRVTTGVIECARLLASRPARVMLCILPEVPHNDVTGHIEHVLLRSFCREHDIRLLTVREERRLAQLLTSHPSPQPCPGVTSSVSCLLVEAPDAQSEADHFVTGYHDVIVSRDILPRPIIQLPG